MAVDIATYRARIGAFNFHTLRAPKWCASLRSSVSVVFDDQSVNWNSIGCVVFITILLLAAGIESNPGPVHPNTVPPCDEEKSSPPHSSIHTGDDGPPSTTCISQIENPRPTSGHADQYEEEPASVLMIQTSAEMKPGATAGTSCLSPMASAPHLPTQRVSNTGKVLTDTEQERVYYSRAAAALTEVCRDALWEVLINIVPANSIKDELKRHPNVQLMGDQRKKLCKKGGITPTANDVDLSAVYTLLRNITPLSFCPTQGWNRPFPPADGDDTVADDTERLRFYRNSLQHRASCQLSEREYLELWANIKAVLTRIGKQLQQNFLPELEAREKMFMDKEVLEAYALALQQMHENYEEAYGAVKSEVRSLRTEIVSVKTEVAGVKTKVAGVASRLEEVTRQETSTVEDISPEEETDLQQYLVQVYSDLLSTVEVSRWCPELQIDDIFTPITIREDMEFGMAWDSNIRAHIDWLRQRTLDSYEDIFSRKNKAQTEIYLLGKAGSGKTMFTLKLVRLWCNCLCRKPEGQAEMTMSRFKFLFHICCRFASKTHSILDMIFSQVCSEFEKYQTIVRKLLKTQPQACLVILDGLDEWSASATEVFSHLSRPGLPVRTGLNGCVALITSRHWRIEALPKGVGTSCRVLEIQDFNRCNGKRLAEKILQGLGESDKECVLSEFFWQVGFSAMREASSVPVILTSLLSTWHTDGQLDISVCVNYSRLVELLLSRAEVKLETDPVLQELKSRLAGQNTPLPPCFGNRPRCKQYAPLLLKLAEIAYTGLVDEHKERALVFKKRDLEERFGEFELEGCLKLGLLSKSRPAVQGQFLTTSVSFIHKSIQEFLAALYIWTDTSSKWVSEITRRYKNLVDIMDIQLVIIFVCGMAPQQGRKLFRVVASLTDTDGSIYRHRHTARPYWLDPVEMVSSLQSLLLTCVIEARRNVSGDLNISTQTLRQKNIRNFLKYQCTGNTIENKLHFTVPDVCISEEMEWYNIFILHDQAMAHLEAIKSLLYVRHAKFMAQTPLEIIQLMNRMIYIERLQIVIPTESIEEYFAAINIAVSNLQHLSCFGIFINTYRSHPLTERGCNLLMRTLQAVPSMKEVFLGRSKFERGGTPSLDFPFHISVLTFQDICISKQVMVQFPLHLSELNLHGVTIRSQAEFPTSLSFLRMNNVTMPHTQIMEFCDFLHSSSSLQSLKLACIICTDCCPPCKYKLDLLRHVHLKQLKLSAIHANKIQLDARSLERIKFQHCDNLAVIDALSPLKSATRLERFSVDLRHGSKGTADCVREVLSLMAHFRSLKKLHIEGMIIDKNHDFAWLVHLNNLTSFRFMNVSMPKECWKRMFQCFPSTYFQGELESPDLGKVIEAKLVSTPNIQVSSSFSRSSGSRHVIFVKCAHKPPGCAD